MRHPLLGRYLAAAGVVHLFSLFGAALTFLIGQPDFLKGPSIPEHVVMIMLLVIWSYREEWFK